MKEFEARNLAFKIIGKFEDLLYKHNIKIPDDDRVGADDEAAIFGCAYYELEDEIVGLLTEEDQEDG